MWEGCVYVCVCVFGVSLSVGVCLSVGGYVVCVSVCLCMGMCVGCTCVYVSVWVCTSTAVVLSPYHLGAISGFSSICIQVSFMQTEV